MSDMRFDNATAFSTRLGEIKEAINQKDKWINDNLEVVNKDCGFVRFWKIIVLPIARFFGADPFGHVRIHTVALVLLEECQQHSKELTNADAESVKYILKTLNTKVLLHKKPREKNQRTLKVAFFAIFQEDLPASTNTQPPTNASIFEIPTPPPPLGTTPSSKPLPHAPPPMPKKKENNAVAATGPSSPIVVLDDVHSVLASLKHVNVEEVNNNKHKDTTNESAIERAMAARRQYIYTEDENDDDDDDDDWYDNDPLDTLQTWSAQ